MNKAVFLDRDGTINKEVNFLTKIEDLEIIEGVPQALKSLKEMGFINIVISNQSGIARGYLTTDTLNEINAELKLRLHKVFQTELIDAIYYSPFLPEGIIPEFSKPSNCRKPGTGMIEQAVLDFEIDTKKSFFIGDSYVDMLCAKNAGIRRILLKTEHNKDAYNKCIEDNIQIDFFAENILSSTEFIESKIKSEKIDI